MNPRTSHCTLYLRPPHITSCGGGSIARPRLFPFTILFFCGGCCSCATFELIWISSPTHHHPWWCIKSIETGSRAIELWLMESGPQLLLLESPAPLFVVNIVPRHYMTLLLLLVSTSSVIRSFFDGMLLLLWDFLFNHPTLSSLPKNKSLCEILLRDK